MTDSFLTVGVDTIYAILNVIKINLKILSMTLLHTNKIDASYQMRK